MRISLVSSARALPSRASGREGRHHQTVHRSPSSSTWCPLQSWQKRDFQIGGRITLFCILAKQDGTPEMKIFLVCSFNEAPSANAKHCSSISGVQSTFDTLFMRCEHWIGQNQLKACLYSTAKIGHHALYTFYVHCHSLYVHSSPLPLPTPLTLPLTLLR